MSHTPTPWEAREGDVLNYARPWGIVRPFTPQENAEADTQYGSEVIAEVCAGTGGRAEADAKFIVKAVNYHQFMLALLNETVRINRTQGITEEEFEANIEKVEAMISEIKGAE